MKYGDQLDESVIGSILRSRVHALIGALLVGSVALWAGLVIWRAATGDNPVERLIVTQEQLPGQ